MIMLINSQENSDYEEMFEDVEYNKGRMRGALVGILWDKESMRAS
jgi:hypothetical protein